MFFLLWLLPSGVSAYEWTEQKAYDCLIEIAHELDGALNASDMFFVVSKIKIMLESTTEKKIELRKYIRSLNKVLRQKKKPLTKNEIQFIVYMTTGYWDEGTFKN